MPAKKTTLTTLKKPNNPQMDNAPAPIEENIGAMEAAVIASLVQSGTPYADAKAQVLGGEVAPKVEDAPIVDPDPEPPVAPKKSRDFSDEQLKLHGEIVAIDQGEGKKEYEVTIMMPQYLFDWAGRMCLQEAAKRNDPSFTLDKFLNWMIKQERAIDPTKGGKISGGSSGPKDSYNPITERWG